MIFVSGDIHGAYGSIRPGMLNKNWKQKEKLNRNDILIVAGDCGVIWDACPSTTELDDIKWVNEHIPYTFTFIDGNHENFERLNSYPVEEWNGGQIHRISDNVIHLMRGEIYDIPDGDDTKRIFTCGGAKSYNRKGIKCWDEEIPSAQERTRCFDQLNEREWNVDYIITHDCPSDMKHQINPLFPIDEVNLFLDSIYTRTKFKKWIFGHYHMNATFNGGTFECVYEDVIKLR